MAYQYREAGRILAAIEQRGGSLKSLVLGNGGWKSDDGGGARKRKLYALVSETLRYKPVMEELVDMAGIRDELFSAAHVRDKSTGSVLLYDLLLGKGSIQGGGALKRHFLQYCDRLQACLVALKQGKGLEPGASNEALLPQDSRRVTFPRYARVNHIKCAGTDTAAAQLRNEGLEVKVDDIVPSLLVLPAGVELHDHAMVKQGQLVLQDKSSCFSAQALLGSKSANEDLTGDILDACAAPGNKTTHLASLITELHATGSSTRPTSDRHVFAFDKDEQRLALLRRRVKEAGAHTIVTPCLQDFLAVDVADARFANVTAILLDPSCSGSGIVSTADRLNDSVGSPSGDGGADRKARLQRLAAFQLAALSKALSFPQVRRVVYSTCSVNQEENEHVVQQAIQQQPEPAPFGLSVCLPHWHRRGLATEGLSPEQSQCMVRTDPWQDSTNGFFVALLERGLAPTSDEVDRTGQAQAAGAEHVASLEKTATMKKKRKKKNKKKNMGTGDTMSGE